MNTSSDGPPSQSKPEVIQKETPTHSASQQKMTDQLASIINQEVSRLELLVHHPQAKREDFNKCLDSLHKLLESIETAVDASIRELLPERSVVPSHLKERNYNADRSC